MLSALPARWLALAFLLLALALVFGNPILLAGSIFVLLIVLLGTLLTPPGGIEVEREMTRLVCWAGDRLEVRRRVHVRSGLGTLYVHDELPAEMEVVEGNNFRAVWKWPGPKTYDLSYEFLCPKRGLYELGETLWDTEGALGLQRRNRGTAGETQEFSVVPRIQAVRRVKEVRARAHTRFFRTDVATLGPSTTDFKDLRPYSPGDPMRIVNWKASARNSYSANPLLVNQYEAEGRKAIWIFLDGAEYMEVGTTLSSLIDHAVEAAGSIAQYYLSQGYTLGAYIYNTPNDILTPDLGRKQFKRLTDMLTTLQPGPARQDLSAAVEWCKSFLYRLQPEVYAITRLDVHYPRDGESGPVHRRVRCGDKTPCGAKVSDAQIEPGQSGACGSGGSQAGGSGYRGTDARPDEMGSPAVVQADPGGWGFGGFLGPGRAGLHVYAHATHLPGSVRLW